MKRAVWIGLGVVGTLVVLRQVAKANERFGAVAKLTSPAGIADSLTSLAVAAKELGEQVRTSIAENEAALMEALMPSEEELARARDVRARRRTADSGDPFAGGVEFTDEDWSD